VKAAKTRGVQLGRKPKPTPQKIQHEREQIDKDKRCGDVAALPNVDRTTLYRAITYLTYQ